MNTKKNLTLNGLSIPNTLNLFINIAMLGVSIYLTNHFFNAYFPTTFDDSSLCNLNNFWSCDHASLSSAGKIFNVPTSFFGTLIGLFGIIATIFPSEAMERNQKFFILLNAIGCLILLFYSLFVLGGLCPFCTLYYLLSFASLFIFIKYSDEKFMPSIIPMASLGVVAIIGGFFFSNHFTTKLSQKDELAKQYVMRFKELKVTSDPATPSPFILHKAYENFSDAPLRVSVFSDFQCPFCKYASKAIDEAISKFKDKLNVQYFYFPLDSSCNHNVKQGMHPYACKASYLASCDKNRFKEVHDLLFKRQSELSFEILDNMEKELGLQNCYNNEDIKKEVLDSIAIGDTFNINSTPVMVINGRKITAALDAVNLIAILQSILDENN